LAGPYIKLVQPDFGPGISQVCSQAKHELRVCARITKKCGWSWVGHGSSQSFFVILRYKL
jgi:hypothetical protein